MTSTLKSAWRSRLRAARRSMDDGGPNSVAVSLAAAGLATAGLEWAGLVAGTAGTSTICAYISMGYEPPTGALLAALDGAGHSVFVPICVEGHQLAWTAWTPGVAMARSRLAPVMEPVGERLPFARLGPVAGVLLPALAVDTAGVRLGQGGGYYDRFLAALGAAPSHTLGSEGPGSGVARAGVVYENELLAAGSLPHDTLDQPVDWVVTPAGFRKIGAGGPKFGS